jgi:Yip1-like protein
MTNPGLSQEWRAFGRRLVGAIRLDGATYRDLSRDPAAVVQAVAVILLSSLASALVFLIDGKSPGLSVDVNWGSYPVTRESDVAAALAGAVLDGGWGIMIWVAQAAIIWFLWNRINRENHGPKRWSAIAAPLGFADAPLIVFALLELVPVVGEALGVVGLLWALVASVVAVREALATGWGRAIGYLVFSTLLLLPFSIAVSRLT